MAVTRKEGKEPPRFRGTHKHTLLLLWADETSRPTKNTHKQTLPNAVLFEASETRPESHEEQNKRKREREIKRDPLPALHN